MYVEIINKLISQDNRSLFDPWEIVGFFVATVGENASEYLSNQVFGLQNLRYCASVTMVNMPCFSECGCWEEDGNKELERFKAETQEIVKDCVGKVLFVLSETENLYAVEQCCELATNVGENGFSILITHEKSKNYEYFSRIRMAFNHIIFLSDDVTHVGDILKWIICDFNTPGLIGVGIEHVRWALEKTTESYCGRIEFKNKNELKNSFSDLRSSSLGAWLIARGGTSGMLGLRAPWDSDLNEIEFIVDESAAILPIETISCIFNEQDDDESWTFFWLTMGAEE